MHDNLKITFEMDGTGIVMYPDSPIHLDSLMVWVIAGKAQPDNMISRESQPDDFELPLKKWHIKNEWGWHASALFPEIKGETVQFWRKKFRQDRSSGMLSQKPNLQSGVYREYNNPLPIVLCTKITAYAKGNIKEILKIIKNIRYIGQKRSYGKGRIIDYKVKKIKEDLSLVSEGKAQRILPSETGIKFIRIRPPYWNITNRIKACSVGDEYSI
jgi:CRISPR type IV-associated protein Csf3